MPRMSRTAVQAVLVFIALIAGAVVGDWLYSSGGASRWWQDLGDLVLIRPLVALSVPIVFVVVAIGMTTISDPKTLGKLGGVTVAFYVGTTLIATVIGAVLVTSIAPGAGADESTSAALRATGAAAIAADTGNADRLRSAESLGLSGAFLSIAQQAIPRNLFAEASAGNTLAAIVAGLLFGVAAALGGARTRPVIALLEGLADILFRIVAWVLVLLPLGVFLLVTAAIAKVGLRAVAGPLAAYMAVVLIGLLIQGVIILPILQRLLGGGNGWRFAWDIRRALLTAFATSSSNASLAVTLEECVENGRCSRQATNFVIPLGGAINSNGTALYESVAVLFLFQLYGVSLEWGEIALVVVAATLAAAGTAGIPAAGLVTMVIVISAANAALAGRGIDPLPLSAIGIIIGVDRILDMSRTVLNVWGDCVAARVVTRLAPDVAPA